jgi:hypothetical protein
MFADNKYPIDWRFHALLRLTNLELAENAACWHIGCCDWMLPCNIRAIGFVHALCRSLTTPRCPLADREARKAHSDVHHRETVSQ